MKRPKLNRRLLLLMALLATVAGWYGAVLIKGYEERNLPLGPYGLPVSPLPALDEITDVTFTEGVYPWTDSKSYQIPKSHWKAILDALTPIKREQFGPERKVWGRMGIRSRHEGLGGVYWIDLFVVDDGPAAFITCSDPSYSLVYGIYLAGDSAKLKAAINEAISDPSA